MSQDNKYTAPDFERYHSGKMSEAEMHALEKAALADPFLADALEGYVYTNTPLKDIAELKEKLLQQKKKKNVFLLSKQNTWMRVAAMVVLIAGIGYMAYQLNFNKEINTLAKKEDSSLLKNTSEQAIVPEQDSFILKDKKDIARVTSPLKGNKTLSNDGNASESVQLSSQVNPVEKSSQFQNDEIRQKPTMNAPAKDYATREEKINDKKEVIADIKSDTLAEVVVTASGMKRQKKQLSRAPELASKAPGVALENASEPVNGWEKFNEYIKSNIVAPADGEGKTYQGNVILSFEINKRGNPKDIKVEQSLCNPCDEEAKRLLRQGPKWRYVKDKRQAITIVF